LWYLTSLILEDSPCWQWPLLDDLGIDQAGNIYNKSGSLKSKFEKTLDSLNEKNPLEKELKDLMLQIKKQGGVIQAVQVDEEGNTISCKHFEGKEHKIVRKIIEAGLNVYMTGPAGCGKSSFARIVAEDYKNPELAETEPGYVFVSCSGDLRPSNLIGHFELINDETKFVAGPIPRAMRDGKVLILDEFDRVGEDVASKLHEVLEAGELLIEATNEMVHAHPYFKVIATGNSDMQGSVEYNTNALDLASIDRFEFIQFGYSPKEQSILVQHGLSGEEAGELMTIVRGSRGINLSLPFSTRRMIAICKLVGAGMTLNDAITHGYINRLPQSERKEVAGFLKNIKTKAEIVVFDEKTPQKVLDEIGKLLKSQEREIFKQSYTAIMNDSVAKYIEQHSEIEQYIKETIGHKGIEPKKVI
jgi:nucleoside-triphosphatase THEP1